MEKNIITLENVNYNLTLTLDKLSSKYNEQYDLVQDLSKAVDEAENDLRISDEEMNKLYKVYDLEYRRLEELEYEYNKVNEAIESIADAIQALELTV